MSHSNIISDSIENGNTEEREENNFPLDFPEAQLLS